MKIRTKISMGFFILALMLITAGVYSIHELTMISSSVQKILDENYRSVNAAKNMIEALEREDSGILLLLLGKWKEGRTTITNADQYFESAFNIASNNITVPGEKDYVDKIRANYEVYRNDWDQPIVSTEYEGNLNWYFEKVNNDFIAVKKAVEDLKTLNNNAMYQTASTLKNRAYRAVMPGIVAMLSALIFVIIFSFFVNLYIVNPILSITNGIQNCLESDEPIKLNIDTKDELHDLAGSVMNLISKVRTLK